LSATAASVGGGGTYLVKKPADPLYYTFRDEVRVALGSCGPNIDERVAVSQGAGIPFASWNL
jgi:hypothetical protein